MNVDEVSGCCLIGMATQKKCDNKERTEMKDYSGLFEIAEASATANNDEPLREMIAELKSMIELNLQYAQQDVADRMGERILELM